MMLLLLLITFALVGAAITPAVIEYLRQSDASPLDIAEDYGEDVRNISYRLETYKRSESQSSAPQRQSITVGHQTVAVNRIQGELVQPDVHAHHSALLCDDGIDAADGSVFTGVYARKPVSLGSSSVVNSWLHTDRHAIIGAHSSLLGNVSAKETVVVGTGSTFERIEAERIEFYDDKAPVHGKIIYEDGVIPICTVPSKWDKLLPWSKDPQRIARKRTLVHGDYEVTADGLFRGNIVCSGRLLVRRGARVHGSIKAGKSIEFERHSLVNGDVFCDGDVTIGEDCHIRGVVFAENRLTIAPRSVIGTFCDRSTVTAAHMIIRAGVRIYGTVWATQAARVIDYRSAA